MNTTTLLIISAVLIAAGLILVWRDTRKRQPGAFVLQRDKQSAAPAASDVEITIARPGPDLPAPTLAMPTEEATGFLDSATVSKRWEALQPVIGIALRQVNLVLAGARVEVGPPGPPSRSINGAFGANCRLQIADENVGSLRLQVTVHDQVHARVKAHGREAAAINASASAPVHEFTPERASDLLSEVMKPAAAFALAAEGGADPEAEASSISWDAIDMVVSSALAAANGALAQAGARFMPLGPPAWSAEAKRHRMAVGIQVGRREIARMHIERVDHEMEVSGGVPDARLMDLGRRRRIPVQGMTTHALAELIAACAWPAIEHFSQAEPHIV
jgi:hypothetical protein